MRNISFLSGISFGSTRLRRLILTGFVLTAAVFSIFAGCSAALAVGDRETGERNGNRIYVMLGMHMNFSHSWRGDTPDEAGFGTDIRIVREVIRILDEANRNGQDARVYWEGENLFTFEEILPRHAPDITEGIRRRIAAGQDEFMPAPYSNTLFSAVTENEMRAVLRWAISNPWGSGARDLFGSWAPLIRPQEAMSTPGQTRILREEGFLGMVLPYSAYAFTGFSNFVPTLPPGQRFHFVSMRQGDDEEKMLLLPSVSAADMVNNVSFERWIRKLRDLQLSGEIDHDLVLHVNFDADSETWLPLLPGPLRRIPNFGGLQEYIDAVNKYDWAEFSVPGEYIAGREPEGEVTIRQDTADGGWDGNYSWAEKYSSHVVWTGLEKSRLASYRAEALSAGAPEEVRERIRSLLYEGRESSFFRRIRGLSTTHFGMSTPIINEERQAAAERTAEAARLRAEEALRAASESLPGRQADEPAGNTAAPADDLLYSFLVKDIRNAEAGGTTADRVTTPVRIPIVFPGTVPPLSVTDDRGKDISASVINVGPAGDGRVSAQLLFFLDLAPGESRTISVRRSEVQDDSAEGSPGRGTEPRLPGGRRVLGSGPFRVTIDPQAGIRDVSLGDAKIGGPDFLSHFITYRTGGRDRVYAARGYGSEPLENERHDGLDRVRLTAEIPFSTESGPVAADIRIDLNVPRDAPWMIADVRVRYPYTGKRDLLATMQQKVRRYLDLNWKEVAPFQIRPLLDADRENPARVWKHNYLDVTSWYDLDYGRLNPKNAEIDSFNHQVTAGWVAVTDSEKGLLISQSADRTSSYAFASMRLRESPEKRQELLLNPFGSYYGRQLDYSHMGDGDLGADLAVRAAASLRPNAPSFNGVTEEFSLMIAPYRGDRPPRQLQQAARNFFYPPAVVYLKTPGIPGVLSPAEMKAWIRDGVSASAEPCTDPLPAPRAFLVNPSDGAADLVWDERDPARVRGYEVQVRERSEEEWESVRIDSGNRCRVPNLVNDGIYEFRMRSLGDGTASPMTPVLRERIGPVRKSGPADGVPLNLSLVARMLYSILLHEFSVP